MSTEHNTPPAPSGQSTLRQLNNKVTPAIQEFFTHLGKLNALARLIEEAPIPTERTDHFYTVYYATLDLVGPLDALLLSAALDKELQALTDAAAWKASENAILKTLLLERGKADLVELWEL